MNHTTQPIRTVSSRSLLLAALASLGASSAFAQAPSAAAADQPIKLEAFVSTGTRFSNRTVTESPVPIDVITRNDITTGGYTETAQVLQTLVPSFNFPRPSLTDGTDHIRPATLRSLAPDQTLVLINGKRRHTSSLVNLNGSIGRGAVSTDFNAIPTATIGSIEVLRDGASAQYGSDAIAGVINVILRKDVGSGFDVSYGATQRGDGRDLNASAYYGTKLGNKGSLFVSVFGRNKSPTNRIQPDTRQQYFGRSATNALTTISGSYGSGTGLSASNGTLDSREATVNRLNHRFGDPRDKSQGTFFNAELPLDNGLTAYVFGGASLKHAEGAGFFRRPGDDRTIRAIWPDGFLPVIQSKVTDLSLGGGVRGKAGDWNWDLSSVTGSNKLEYITAQSINDTLGAASKTSFKDGSLKFNQTTTNLDLTNQYDLGLGSPLKVALGAEFRAETYTIGAGEPDSYRDGGLLILDGPNAGTRGGSAPGAQVFSGFKPADAGAHDRNAKAVYVDFEQNITPAWLVSVAGRFEDYSDFGNKATGKFATRLEVSKEFAFRGSISTGFRAPHLAQEWFSSTATNNIAGLGLVEVSTFPVTNAIGRALGASDLKPETSTNKSVGFTFQPSEGFSGSVDYYSIKIKDRIVLSSNYTGTAVASFLTSRGLPAVGGGRYFTNAVDTTTEGLDLTVRHKTKLSSTSRLTLTASANVNRTSVTNFKNTPAQLAALGITTPLFDVTERVRIERGQPRSSINLMANYDVKSFSFMLRTIRYGEVQSNASGNGGWSAAQVAALTPGYNVSFEPAIAGSAAGNQQVIQTFSAKWITDLDVTYRFSKRLSAAVGVNNLFNIYPSENIRSRVVGGVAYSGSDNVGIFPYSSVSPFGFNGASFYGKVSWKF